MPDKKNLAPAFTNGAPAEDAGISIHEWRRRAEALFGANRDDWRFRCPACGHEATAGEWKAAGAGNGMIGFSCIGRLTESPREAFGKGPGPCDYAGGGLFGLNPLKVDIGGGKSIRMFDFADAPEES